MGRFKRKLGPVRAKKVTHDGVAFASGLEKYMYCALKEAGVKREYKTEKYIEKTLKKEALEKKTVVNNYYANDKPALDFDTFSTFMDKYNQKQIPVKQEPLEKPKPIAAPIPIPPRNIKYCGINF